MAAGALRAWRQERAQRGAGVVLRRGARAGVVAAGNAAGGTAGGQTRKKGAGRREAGGRRVARGLQDAPCEKAPATSRGVAGRRQGRGVSLWSASAW